MATVYRGARRICRKLCVTLENGFKNLYKEVRFTFQLVSYCLSHLSLALPVVDFKMFFHQILLFISYRLHYNHLSTHRNTFDATVPTILCE
jgi:hypothetical protein